MPVTPENLVVALDFEEMQDALHFVDALGEDVVRYKVGPQLFTPAGPAVIRELQARGKQVFLDLKLHDTPQVVSRTVELVAGFGAEFLTVHCLGGRTMLEAAGSACRGSKLRVIGVTLLTSQGAADSYSWGWPQPENGMVLRLAGLAMECRLAGVMCSPQELQALRPKTVPGFLLTAAGIRMPGQDVFQDDQRRTASPADALAWGADLLIVGRPLTQAREPARALEALFGRT